MFEKFHDNEDYMVFEDQLKHSVHTIGPHINFFYLCLVPPYNANVVQPIAN